MSEVSTSEISYVNSNLFNSNSDRSEKYSQNTDVSKKEIETAIQPEEFNELEKQLTGSMLYKMVVWKI